jgi:hypothetical protein
MTELKNQDSALKKLTNAAIEWRLGDISGLPKELVEYVFKLYREFVASYLNM